jgi:DNA-binding MarR family transcriptional regulator
VTEASDIAGALQRLLDAYERLGVVRRRELGLNTNEESVLLHIGHGMGTPSGLSRAIGMTTAGMTNMLDRLEADDLVRRQPHDTDKRRVLLTLTKKGFRAQLDLEATHERVGRLTSGDVHATVHVREFLEQAAALVESQADERSKP